MTFRTKLLVVTSLTVAGAVALVTGVVSVATRRAFETMDQQRRNALLDQFQKQLDAQGDEITRRIRRIAASDEMLRIAIEASRREPDLAPFLQTAAQQAEGQSLDFLDVLKGDATIVSSAHWPARFGFRNDWLITAEDWQSPKAFLTRIPAPEGTAVALIAVQRVNAGEEKITIAGGKRLNRQFLESLGVAPGVRALLWLSSSEVLDARGPVADAAKLTPLVEQARATAKPATGVIRWREARSSSEALLAMPLLRGDTMLGVLLAGTSLADQMWLEQWILYTGVLVGGSGILLGVLVGWWTTERVSRPVAQLASAAKSVAAGDLSARVPVAGKDEIGSLGRAFNHMTQQLIEQRERAIQAERVAAWRELARRLAHELKNPLFPLQITVENLQRSRTQTPEEFDEVFRESTGTLLKEISNLKTIIGRFSDFSRMPAPRLEPVDLNGLVRDTLQLFDAQWKQPGRAPIEAALELSSGELQVEADPEQLGRALRNLVLNAMDAMPEGGTLTVRTQWLNGTAHLEVSDTGKGMSEEEASRLFTPYYTTKQHGTGLGLAIVQSVISDHKGRIAVHSEPGKGATFTIDLPARNSA
ncbi:MAG: HAMP domain-containing protein [Acidobacteria bacterium]|nr:HAMP domain-containing protein [Acidobacteriota bacterium]